MCSFFFSSRRRHTRCALVTGVQTCALPISFVNAEKASHAMSRAMRIIEACRPKILACQHIKLRPSRAFWKLRSGKGDVALENQREALLHFIGRCADGDSAGHISGAKIGRAHV